jgi:hypothetical protein
LPGR